MQREKKSNWLQSYVHRKAPLLWASARQAGQKCDHGEIDQRISLVVVLRKAIRDVREQNKGFGHVLGHFLCEPE